MLFLIGYYIISEDEIMDEILKYRFVILIIFQFYLSKYTKSTWILFIIPMLATYIMTLLTSKLIIKIPYINKLFGIK